MYDRRMSNRIRIAIIVAAVLAFVAVLAWWQPPFFASVDSWLRDHREEIDVVSVAMTAVFTLLLAIWTWTLSRVTRDAALASARAVTELERPQVFVEVIDTGLQVDGSGGMTPSGYFKFQCFNVGRSAAVLLEMRTVLITESKPAMAYPIPPEQGGVKLPVGVVSSPDKPYAETRNLLAEAAKVYESNFWKTGTLFFLGWIRYADIFGNRYITGFCSQLDPLANRFVLIGDEKYNYVRQEAKAPSL
jgi:hypothetical protein